MPPEFQPARLWRATRLKGYTQQQIAEALGLSLRTVHDWFHGSQPRGANLLALAELLEEPVAYFFEPLDDPNGEPDRAAAA